MNVQTVPVVKSVIVLIDDDPDDAMLLRDSISAVEPASICIEYDNPITAIEELASMKSNVSPDYIFIDFNMPMINGEECLRQLRSIAALTKSKFIVSSTSMPPPLMKRLKEAGASFSFQKPNKFEEYRYIISRIMSLTPASSEAAGVR